MQNKIIRFIAYFLFFLIFLVYFVIQGFPVELIGQRMSQEVEEFTGMRLTYNRIDTLFPNGIKFDGVRLTEKTFQENTIPISLAAERVSARISLMSLLGGKNRYSISSDLLAGNMNGTALIQDGQYEIKADLNGLELVKLGFLSEQLGQELQGRFHGSIDLNVPSKDIRTIKAEVVFEMEQGKIGNQPLKIQLAENIQQLIPTALKDKLMKGIKLPWISLGKSYGKLVIDKGKLVISDFRIESDDLETSLEGYFQLQSKIRQAIAHLTLRFKPSEQKIKELLTQLPAQYRDLAKDTLNGELDKAKGNDGYYRYRIDGRIFNPRTRISTLFKPVKM